jgi:hypothetical protein
MDLVGLLVTKDIYHLNLSVSKSKPMLGIYPVAIRLVR